MIAAAIAAASRVISGATAEWRCDPTTDAQRIYFANHSSHLDFIVIWAALPVGLRQSTRPVAGQDYWDRGRVRRYVANRIFRAVLVERVTGSAVHARAAAEASVQRMAEEMAERYSLIVFPEGTRSSSGKLGSFKSGLYHLSRLRPDAELIPVYLENLNRILPKGEAVPVPMLSRVVFGPRLKHCHGEDKEAFLERARVALLELGSLA